MRTLPVGALPVVTAEQMREVDRVMMEDLGVGILQMMENAGRSLAWLCQELYAPASVTILAGTGGNGGGGMAAARHLANRGVRVHVVLGRPQERMTAPARAQRATLQAMGVSVSEEPTSTGFPEAVIDALVGYSLAGPPHGRVAELIAWANGPDAPVISLDVPSGFDAQDGAAMTPCVWADATLTIAAPKVGLINAPEAGRTYLADISVPTEVFRVFGYAGPAIFTDDWIVEVGQA